MRWPTTPTSPPGKGVDAGAAGAEEAAVHIVDDDTLPDDGTEP
ncbi:DUF5709 domain-containing protein [Streptomyces sp. NPDC087787]